MTEPVLLDLRGEQHPVLFPRRKKADGKVVNTSQVVLGKTVVRAPSTVTGIVLHQTACVFGPSDPARRHRRALAVPCHALAFRDGTYACPAPLPWFLYTSNGFNATTLGLEVEGKYRGLERDPNTCWGGNETPLDELTVATARAAMRWLVEEGRKLGMPIRLVYAHRQSNGQKPSDPGEGLWKRVVLEYAVPVLGLSTAPSRTMGDGKPIPRAWQPDATGSY